MPPDDHNAYTTHLNYIRCLADLMSSATLTYSGVHLRVASLPHVGEKQNLIQLTRQSLEDEHRIVQIDEDYSYASTSWLPIKSYYLVFNVLLTIEYILTLRRACFRMGHLEIVNAFTRRLEVGHIQFSEPILNEVFDGRILNYRTPSGTNLSRRTSPSVMYKLVMKKIAKYKEEDWRRKRTINLRIPADRNRHRSYVSTRLQVSVFDFAYFMRLRSNYRDFAFIDGISTAETAEYFNHYFRFTTELFGNLENLKTDLANQRD